MQNWELYREASELEAEVIRRRENANKVLRGLNLEGEAARDRLARAKPPR